MAVTKLEEAKKALKELATQYGWKVWATEVQNSGWCDGEKEIVAIVEITRGKILKIKGGAYADPKEASGWMVESQSGGWHNLSLEPEVRNHGKFVYMVVGHGPVQYFNAVEALLEKYPMSGVEMGRHLVPELQGQPRLHGLVGPMADGFKDGMPVIRYETADVYDSLSR
ncbi:MAG: hypothetical protein K6T83_03765 [Alicyclobacillus sp.]|nr:hypothetical protein [Alicyclobacillus sp.]